MKAASTETRTIGPSVEFLNKAAGGWGGLRLASQSSISLLSCVQPWASELGSLSLGFLLETGKATDS